MKTKSKFILFIGKNESLHLRKDYKKNISDEKIESDLAKIIETHLRTNDGRRFPRWEIFNSSKEMTDFLTKT